LSLLVGVALVRAGDLTGARQLIEAARASAPRDSELLRFEAALRLELNEVDQASQLIALYLERNPNARARIENGRMFKALRASSDVTRAAN
jgi:hypothetical protein